MVSIHASARDATGYDGCVMTTKTFQSTRPRGTRLHRTAGGGLALEVSIHASARDATYNRIRPLPAGYVSIHASARDATGISLWTRRHWRFQSTRPRGTRPSYAIHRDEGYVSIHASARDATQSSRQSHQASVRFNPRVRAGRDVPRRRAVRLVPVSIHASARDATYCTDCVSAMSLVSIHASARDATISR